MPINITPQPGLGGRLAEALATSQGAWGQGYAKMAPQLTDARRTGATSAAITLAPFNNAMDQFGASYRQSYQMAGQLAMQQKSIDAQKALQASAHANALSALGQRQSAAAHEQLLTLTGGKAGMYDVKDPQGNVVIQGINSLYQQEVSKNPDLAKLGLPEFTMNFVDKLKKDKEDMLMAQRNLVRGPDPADEAWIKEKIDNLDPSLFPKGSDHWNTAADIIRKQRPPVAWYEKKPNFQDVAKNGTAVVGKGPDGRDIIAHSPNLRLYQPDAPAGGRGGSAATQPARGPDGRPIVTADDAIDVYAKAAGVTVGTYDPKSGKMTFSSEAAQVYINAAEKAATILGLSGEPVTKESVRQYAKQMLKDIAELTRESVEGPTKMAPHIQSMYEQLEAFRAKYPDGNMPEAEKARFAQLFGLYRQAQATQPSN